MKRSWICLAVILVGLLSSRAVMAQWQLNGNAGTTPGTNFLGTTDNKALEIKVNNVRALRLEPALIPNVIGGSSGNSVASGMYAATVSGGDTNTASANYATVGGGSANTASAQYAIVGGGYDNTASGHNATVAGGQGNNASAVYATIGGGIGNTAGSYATAAGGYSNTANGSNATVGGGHGNTAGADYATVGGGNTNTAGGLYATVGGGLSNIAGLVYATVSGGYLNKASGDRTTIAGGTNNAAGAAYATVGGGGVNTASGPYATVPGGSGNIAQGQYSFAAGKQAKAIHDGVFIWADSTAADLKSHAANQFIARASGGVYFYSAATISAIGGPGVRLPAGASSWINESDRSSKENFADVDGQVLLARLAAIPIQTWNWRAQGTVVRHIGPTGQDFYAAFGLGEDDKHISTVDADGVALAAIQALYRLTQEQEKDLRSMKQQVSNLKAELLELRAKGRQ